MDIPPRSLRSLPPRGRVSGLGRPGATDVTPRFVEPVTLRGTHATLEPLAEAHLDGIRAAAADGELWRLWYTSVPSPDATERWFATALDLRERLGAMAFAVRDIASGDIVGSTRYFNVDAQNRRLEIGHTWYAKRAQRTAINTECKLLLLTHAFEALEVFFDLREVPGLKKKPSTSELLDWLKLLLAEDIPPEALKSHDRKAVIPPLHGALLKNEQDVHLFERVAFMARAGR